MSAGAGMANERPRSWWIPYAFIGFFGFVLAINLVMIWLAVSTWTGLETEDAYARGLAYNRSLQAARAQADQGWSVDLDLGIEGDRRVRVEIVAMDPYSNLIRDADVRARFVRPTHAGHDREIALERQPDGAWRGAARLPLSGQWDVEVGIAGPQGAWQGEERVFVP